jgi:hypothetical protein
LNFGTPDSSYVNPKTGTSDYGPFPATMTGRNIFVGPGNWNLDFAIHKNFSLTERMKVQFRAETFNTFNHSNLYMIGGSTDYSVVGVPNSFVTASRGVRADNTSYSFVSKDNRNMQLALKFIF